MVIFVYIYVLQLSYMIKWLVFMGLFMFKKFVQALRFIDPLRLVREQHCISVEGHSQLCLWHLSCFLRFEHGGCCDPLRPKEPKSQLQFNSVGKYSLRYFSSHLPPRPLSLSLNQQRDTGWCGRLSDIQLDYCPQSYRSAQWTVLGETEINSFWLTIKHEA